MGFSPSEARYKWVNYSMKPYLLLLFGVLILSCTDKDDEEPDDPGIAIIAGSYSGTLQHDVIRNTNSFEEIDTTFVVHDILAMVSFNDQEQLIIMKFLNTRSYTLPELKYSVRKIEQQDLFNWVDVHLELLTTDDYRRNANPSNFSSPAFRIWPKSSYNEFGQVELNIFLRSQDPDSVYNISVIGMKN